MVIMMQATAKITPKLVEHSFGITMTNDLTEAKPEEALSCFAYNYDDSLLVSASGGKIIVFNVARSMVMFETKSL
jgi:hypothetical protein